MSKHASRPVELIARGVLLREGELLLCRNLKKGYWYLPGGHVDPGESAAQALAREFVEELGIRVKVWECALVTEAAFGPAEDRHNEINLVFHVEQSKPSGPPGSLTMQSLEPGIGFAWHKVVDLSGLDLRPANIRRWLLWRLGHAGQAGGAAPDAFTKVLWASDLE